MRQTFEQFTGTRYWPQLDGLRTVSILLVIVGHMNDPFWGPIEGSTGVIMFFVISGFLITSLLIREEERSGRVSLSSFYIRRIFRIVPMYMLALAVMSVLIFVAHQGDASSFAYRLPFLLTFNGEFVQYGTFVHAWSIGVEEKFYILWPLLAFTFLALRRRRAGILSVAVPLVIVAALVPATSYAGMYVGILLGCALSVAMHNRRGFNVVSRLASPAIGTALVCVMLIALAIKYVVPALDNDTYVRIVFAFAVVLVFPFLVVGGGWLTRGVGWRPLAFIGTRTYGIYLFHALCIDLVGRAIPDGQGEAGLASVRLVLSLVLSYGVAEILFRTFENPLILIGRKLARRATPRRRALPVDLGRDVPSVGASERGREPHHRPEPVDHHRPER